MFSLFKVGQTSARTLDAETKSPTSALKLSSKFSSFIKTGCRRLRPRAGGPNGCRDTSHPRLGPASGAIDHFDRAGDQDFAGSAGLEECVAGAEGNSRLGRPSRLRAARHADRNTLVILRRFGGKEDAPRRSLSSHLRPGLTRLRGLGVPADGRGRWLVRSKQL